MATTTAPGEDSQLLQTIEMFEAIAQSQPNDCPTLEILKEAYTKAGRHQDVINTSKRIAEAYVGLGQYSSAILEFESILQHTPGDEAARKALAELEAKAASVSQEAPATDTTAELKPKSDQPRAASPEPGKTSFMPMEDGRRAFHKLFVESKTIAESDFNLYWPKQNLAVPVKDVVEPFIQVLADNGILPVEKAIRLLCDKTRAAYLPLNLYDMDMDLARTFPAETCRRWCVLPFDRMSKSILVATANPFNQQAAKELAEATNSRLLWYLVPPVDLVKNLRKAFH